jgi:ABC-type multidrug transport system permease subunit
MGWKRHPRQASADFLTAITNPGEREAKAGMSEKVPRTSEDFEAYWKQSPEYVELREMMRNYAQSFPLDGTEETKLNHAKRTEQANHVRPSSTFLLSVAMQVRLCLVRAYRRSLNDRAGIIATAVVQIVLAVLIGSLFYDIPASSAGLAQRASVIFLAVLTNNLIALLEINVLYSQRPIVEKHARYTFVHPFAEALAGVIMDLPIKVLRCLIASVIIYFMAHLRREPGHFFIYILLQLISVVTMSGLFRCLATVTKTLSQAMALGGIIIICIAVYTGFTIPQPDMRPWLGWIRWLNPIFYAFEGIITNEFHGLRFKCVEYIPDYPSLLGLSFTCSEVGAVAGEHYVSGDRYLEKRYEYFYSHLWRNFGVLIAFFVLFHILYLILTELVPGTASAPKTLAFLPGHIPANLSRDDVEARQGLGLSKELLKSDAQSRLLLAKQENIFTWQGLCYDVPIKGGTKRLLEDVSGWVKPWTFTALMVCNIHETLQHNCGPPC